MGEMAGETGPHGSGREYTCTCTVHGHRYFTLTLVTCRVILCTCAVEINVQCTCTCINHISCFMACTVSYKCALFGIWNYNNYCTNFSNIILCTCNCNCLIMYMCIMCEILYAYNYMCLLSTGLLWRRGCSWTIWWIKSTHRYTCFWRWERK